MFDRYLFNKDITRQFIALEDDRPFKLPTQNPTIYVYTQKPSLTEAAAGTGAVAAAVTSWNQSSVDPYPNTYTLTAIADPASTSDVPSRVYWESITYITKTAGTSITHLRSFIVERADTKSGYPSITGEDLAEIYPAITSYLNSSELAAMIANNLEELIIDLEARGLDWGKLGDLRKLRLALAYKCIAESCLSEVKQEGDRFDYRYNKFLEKYNAALKAVQLPYDEDGDGKAEAVVQAKRGYWILDT